MGTKNVALISLAVVTIAYGRSPASHWGYGENNGPDKWPELFPDKCAGQFQSPVDIRPPETVYNQRLTNFIFNDPPHWGGQYIAHNNGHSIQVDTQGVFLLANGGLTHSYRIVQYHFHWGDDDGQGAEHSMNDDFAPMEMHIVSWNWEKYSNIAEAANQTDGLAVLGILFKISQFDNPVLEPLIQAIPRIRDPDWNKRIEIPVVPLREFLPNSPEKYFRYQGSLTTPRCFESVTWTVFKERQTISMRQLNVFRQVLTSASMSSEVIELNTMQANNNGVERGRLVNNYRPVLPLNGRVIQRSFKFKSPFGHR